VKSLKFFIFLLLFSCSNSKHIGKTLDLEISRIPSSIQGICDEELSNIFDSALKSKVRDSLDKSVQAVFKTLKLNEMAKDSYTVSKGNLASFSFE